MKKMIGYFTKTEFLLWSVSVMLIIAEFFVNYLYGFINWRRMERKQRI